MYFVCIHAIGMESCAFTFYRNPEEIWNLAIMQYYEVTMIVDCHLDMIMWLDTPPMYCVCMMS